MNEPSKYRLYIQPAIMAILSIALVGMIIRDCNKPDSEQIITLTNANKSLTHAVDSVTKEREAKDKAFSELQKVRRSDSTSFVRAIAKGDSFKLLYLSLNKQHAHIHRDTRSLSSDSLQMFWAELTR